MAYKSSKSKSVSPIDPGCKKTIYNSREEAEDMIRHIQENRVVRELHAYQCSTCGLWHLSSKSKGFMLLCLLLLFQSLVYGVISDDTITVPIPAHAHNDYLHERPLLDALDNGFRSIEADVIAVGDSLYVAHDRKDIMPGRTLRALYLNPLMEYISDKEGSIYDSASPLILLVDIKDDGLATYQLLDRILNDYREILCGVSRKAYVRGSVMIVVSGNRPIEYMMQQTERFSFVDGRLNDLLGDYGPHLMPLISDRWPKYFSWKGKGAMPEKEKKQLRTYVQLAHDNGQLIRFWATPDRPGKERDTVWNELLEAGVDLINTDDLTGLRAFLTGISF
ncbi:MAG: phosphatidylinositol-specific phospholipase C/glycerophosphodiester phosphodiesterase family protein [Bacteroidota bacterium]|nr:phosphatidylinositol-specific phospholipase C/glycerophosphodiester phosphodiesterase family protein [Bacteroidota bacterium]